MVVKALLTSKLLITWEFSICKFQKSSSWKRKKRIWVMGTNKRDRVLFRKPTKSTLMHTATSNHILNIIPRVTEIDLHPSVDFWTNFLLAPNLFVRLLIRLRCHYNLINKIWDLIMLILYIVEWFSLTCETKCTTVIYITV